MASEVDIVNSALLKIGESRISSLIEGSVEANIANELYYTLRDRLLRMHTWNFATKREKLAQIDTPISGFDYKYAVPSDFVRVVAVYDNDADTGVLEYRVEHDSTNNTTAILTNSVDCYLTYVACIEDVNRMPPDFREALSYLLAKDFALALAKSNTLFDRMEREFPRALRSARAADGIEDFPPQFSEGSWVGVRD